MPFFTVKYQLCHRPFLYPLTRKAIMRQREFGIEMVILFYFFIKISVQNPLLISCQIQQMIMLEHITYAFSLFLHGRLFVCLMPDWISEALVTPTPHIFKVPHRIMKPAITCLVYNFLLFLRCQLISALLNSTCDDCMLWTWHVFSQNACRGTQLDSCRSPKCVDPKTCFFGIVEGKEDSMNCCSIREAS